MKALLFLIWIRDEVLCCPGSKENAAVGLPSNGELRRWLDKGMVQCNGEIIKRESEVEFPVTNLVFFPNHKPKEGKMNIRCTIV